MIKFNIKLVAPLVAFILISINSFGHFGSKGPYGGTVTCSAHNSDTMVYLGTEEGGVYFNKSQTLVGWSAKPVGLKSGRIAALSHTGSYLFCATADSGVFRFTGFVGSDRYWEKVNTGLTNLNTSALVSLDTITLIAGTDNGELFKTTNKGASWSLISGLPFAGSRITGLIKVGTRLFLIAENKGVYYSDNNGTSWSSLNDLNTADITGTNSFSYNATTDELLVLNVNGLYILSSASTVTTASYSLVVTGLPLGLNIRSISNNGTTWYLATDNGVYSSVTGLISWSAVNTGLTTLDVNIVEPYQTRLICGTHLEGIFKTAASSVNWAVNNTGFNNITTYSVATSGAQVIVAATEKGVFVSKNLATSYTSSNNGLTDYLNVNDLSFFGSKLFAVTQNNGVFVSADTGAVWNAFNGGLTEMNVLKIFASGTYVYIYDGVGNIYQSNGTSNWVSITGNLPQALAEVSLAFFGDNILLGVHGGGIYTRKEVSGTWTANNLGLPTDHVTAVTAFGSKIYAGTHDDGVFVSDANTINWTATAPTSINHTSLMGLNGNEIEAMATYGGYVFASYRGGLLATRDHGQTWVEGGNQFNLPSYTAVNKISFVTTRVFVTTEHNSLYSNSLSELELNVGINYSPASNLCFNDCNGALSLSATGGTAPYTYSWSTSETTQSISNLCAGIYYVTITDAVSATHLDSVVISQPDSLQINFTTVPSYGIDGVATANVTGGVSPFTYAWENLATTNSITGLSAGVYSVTVTDANGCSTLDSAAILVNTAGLVELDKNAAIQIVPNPSKGNVTILLNNDVKVSSIEIYNGVGNLLAIQKVDKVVNSIPLSVNYSTGVYFIQLNTENGVETKKMIIE
jgi:hypothetical protein